MRIKRKVSISCLGGRLGICLLLALCRNCFFAQEDSVRFIRDSIQIQPEFNESLFLLLSFLLKTLPLLPCFIRSTPIPCPIFTERVSLSALSDQSPAISGDYSIQTVY